MVNTNPNANGTTAVPIVNLLKRLFFLDYKQQRRGITVYKASKAQKDHRFKAKFQKQKNTNCRRKKLKAV